MRHDYGAERNKQGKRRNQPAQKPRFLRRGLAIIIILLLVVAYAVHRTYHKMPYEPKASEKQTVSIPLDLPKRQTSTS